jgi:ABC-type multidrug transport system ATPase subunit
VIIIDEPELNLHPNNQILIARFLGRLVNEGFKVIASTHSDYIIMELNNLIMLTKPNPQVADLMTKYGYAENQRIKPKQVGAYVFQQNLQHSQNIQVTETGLEIETIDEVVKIVNDSSRDIYFTLFD